MTKGESEAQAAAYEENLRAAREARRRGDIEAMLRSAVEALPFVDGMMRHYERTLDAAFESVEAIDLILTYAPAVFDVAALDALGETLKAKRRIDREASADLAALLQDARRRMFDYHRVWSMVETYDGLLQADLNDHLGGDQTYWRRLVERLEEVGVLYREPAGGTYRLSFRTQMDRPVEGICAACGQRHRIVKELMLAEVTCLACETKTMFVICE